MYGDSDPEYYAIPYHGILVQIIALGCSVHSLDKTFERDCTYASIKKGYQTQ